MDDEPAHAGKEDPEADILREMIGFAAERPVELEVGAATGAGYGEKSTERQVNAMATVNETGRPGPAPSSCS